MKMYLRYLVPVSLTVVVLILTGCDPKEMIERKVPDTLKDVMSSEEGRAKKAMAERKGRADKIELTLVSPQRNSVHPVGQEIVFEAKAVVPSPPGTVKPKVTWTLYHGAAIKQGAPLGTGERVVKKLDAGQYKVSAKMLVDNQEKIATTAFRVANTIEGHLTSGDGAVLPDAELELSKLDEDKPLHTARSGQDGRFAIEIPAEGFFKLIPKKDGYNFFPYRRIVKFVEPPVSHDFKGTKGRIGNIKITEDPQGETAIESVCPLQQSYVSFTVKSDSEPVRVETHLVGIRDGRELLVPMEDASDDPAAKPEIRPEGTVLKLQVPSTPAGGSLGTEFRLRVTVQDRNNNQFSAEAEKSLDYDILSCFRRALADGVELQKKGNLEAAVKSYRLLQHLHESVDDPSQFRKFVEQSTFNRGLAFLAMAMAKPKDDIDRETLLARAASDLDATLGRNEGDLDARLFMGLTLQLAGVETKALSQYNKILAQEPRYPAVRELRALARMKLVEDDLKRIKNDFEHFGKEDIRELFSRLEQRGRLTRSDTALLRSGSTKAADRIDVLLKAIDRFQKELERKLLAVVDDFTEAVKSRPEDNSLRISRRETLKTVLDLQDAEVDPAKFRANVRNLMRNEPAPHHLDHPALKINVSNISRRDTASVADPGQYVRK
ncbi:MAG: hypothetical protein RDU20_07230 [Desulfomonilaceae bacterium]|nr:hypothetical protein [Desulfomonilaceae bacterium]